MNRLPDRYIDVRKLNVADLAAALVEERKAANEERIKPYKTWIGLDGQTPFPVGSETELKRRELEGVKAVSHLARSGHRTIVWISPPGSGREEDECKYTESRVIVYQVESIEETRVNFSCVAICGQHSQRQCLEVANSLLDDGGDCRGELVVANDLRSEPIGLSSDVVDWVSYLENKIPGVTEVWRAIRNGVHEENSRQAWMMAQVIVREFSGRASRVKTDFEAVLLGVELERMIKARFEVTLMAGGVHGMSNEAILGHMGAFDGLYSRIDGDSRLQRCKHCGNFYIKAKEKCPLCG
ncbi:MAG: hypothetical protein WC851_01910 [Candidatus Shapirobacteria bacterium]|jgi:rubrerythrin